MDVVDFRTYVKNVLSREWISSWTTESLRSGALAVKHYAWYQVVHWRGYTNAAGARFDVFDSTRDQHYDPSRPTYASMAVAVDATWGTVALKGGRLFATYYNAGAANEPAAPTPTAGRCSSGARRLRPGRPECRPDPGHLLRRRDGQRPSPTGRASVHAGTDPRSDGGTDAEPVTDHASTQRESKPTPAPSASAPTPTPVPSSAPTPIPAPIATEAPASAPTPVQTPEEARSGSSCHRRRLRRIPNRSSSAWSSPSGPIVEVAAAGEPATGASGTDLAAAATMPWRASRPPSTKRARRSIGMPRRRRGSLSGWRCSGS